MSKQEQFDKLSAEGQAASQRLFLAKEGIVTLSPKEKRSLALYAYEWLAKNKHIEAMK